MHSVELSYTPEDLGAVLNIYEDEVRSVYLPQKLHLRIV